MEVSFPGYSPVSYRLVIFKCDDQVAMNIEMSEIAVIVFELFEITAFVWIPIACLDRFKDSEHVVKRLVTLKNPESIAIKVG